MTAMAKMKKAHGAVRFFHFLGRYGVVVEAEDEALCIGVVETPFTVVTVIFGEPGIYVPTIWTVVEPPTKGSSAARTPASDEFFT